MLSMSVITSLVPGQSPVSPPGCSPARGGDRRRPRPHPEDAGPQPPARRSELFLSVYVGRVGRRKAK